jgi:hypothetical protein
LVQYKTWLDMQKTESNMAESFQVDLSVKHWPNWKRNIDPIEKEKKNYNLRDLNLVPSTLKIALNSIYYASYVVIKFIL